MAHYTVGAGFCKCPQIMEELQVAQRPHTIEFVRYDMLYNTVTSEWETLEEIRRQGRYVKDVKEEVFN